MKIAICQINPIIGDFKGLDLPKTSALMSRAITLQITINMDEQIPGIIKAIEKAAKAI
jgi:hypothetical protein